MTRTIAGVACKPLVTHPDERGYFRELIRTSDPFFAGRFGQWSVSHMHTGVLKAWHWHQEQTDWWYVASGAVKLAVHDMRDKSPTRGTTQEFFLGDNYPAQIIKIEPGIAHGCLCLQGPALLFYVTSHEYDPADEFRLSHDDPTIGYDWLARKND